MQGTPVGKWYRTKYNAGPEDWIAVYGTEWIEAYCNECAATVRVRPNYDPEDENDTVTCRRCFEDRYGVRVEDLEWL